MRSRKCGMMKNKLQLHMELYSEKAVRNTMEAFGNMAGIVCQKKASYYELTFEKCWADEQRTMREFGNFALAEMIKDKGEIYD